MECPNCKRIMSNRKIAVGTLNDSIQTVYNFTCYNKECEATDFHVYADEYNKRGKSKYRGGLHPQTNLVHPARKRRDFINIKHLKKTTGQDLIDDIFKDYGDR